MQPTRHARAALIALAIPATVLLLATPLRAQTYDPNYPVCLQIYQGPVDYYYECGYTTMAQCQASASGRAASCVINPYYGYGKTKPPARSKRVHN